MDSTLELRDSMGADLEALVREQTPAVVSVSRISSLWSPSWDRAAFRLRLASGASCKGRRFESQEAADRVAGLSRHLPEGPFPRVLARRGVAQIAEWVDGTVLSAAEITNDLLSRAGEILGSMHAVDLPREGCGEAGALHAGALDALAARVAVLCRAGALSPAEGERTLRLAAEHAPAGVRVGLVHGDLCPENIVLQDGGTLRVIDTDSIALRAREHDLARVWYRWPMTADERAAFEERYPEKDVLASYRQHFLHWAIVVLVGAAQFRLRHSLPGVSAPLQRLRAVLT